MPQPHLYHHSHAPDQHARAHSPGYNDDLNEEEEEMVQELLTRTPRTSYTVTPSVLAAEVHSSLHHDEDLCVLLHAADDSSTHDVVKRAVRKAIRSRLKRLGMKGDNDVRPAECSLITCADLFQAIRAFRDVHNWEFHPSNPTPVIVQAPAPPDAVCLVSATLNLIDSNMLAASTGMGAAVA